MTNEKRLIDANAALEKLCEYCICGCYEQCEERCVEFRDISKLPTVDAVEVVRCKDCKWRREWLSGNSFFCCNPYYGMASGVELKDDDFCSYGEKREGE